jgi:NitT/TauT family transport system ATP-binding protein
MSAIPSARARAPAATEHTPAIEVRHLAKRFSLHGKEIDAVNDVSFAVRRGEFVSLLGPSGSGKSTILNMVATLITSSGGDILIDGAAQQHGRAHPDVGYVFQKDTLFPWRTVEQNIGYGLELAGVPQAEMKMAVAAAIEQAGLCGFEQAYPSSLSGGMRQRVSLMRALVRRPKILLMDEPFGALDTHTKLGMHGALLDIWERDHQTVLFVTHDLAEALTLSDRIILLSARPGRIKEIFDVDLPRPRDEVSLRETPRYAELSSRIWHSLGEEYRKVKPE